jgi:hypothetical protein
MVEGLNGFHWGLEDIPNAVHQVFVCWFITLCKPFTRLLPTPPFQAYPYGKKKVVAASLFGLILACVWTVAIGESGFSALGPPRGHLLTCPSVISCCVPYLVGLAHRRWRLYASLFNLFDGI